MPLLSGDVRDKVHRMPGVTVRVIERCEGCGTCVEKGCFVKAIRLEGGRAV